MYMSTPIRIVTKGSARVFRKQLPSESAHKHFLVEAEAYRQFQYRLVRVSSFIKWHVGR